MTRSSSRGTPCSGYSCPGAGSVEEVQVANNHADASKTKAGAMEKRPIEVTGQT